MFARVHRLIVACIPAYNEEKTIAKVVLLAKRQVDRVIVCDDGSIDMTAEIAEIVGAEVMRHEKRMGYGAAIRTLFERAKTLSADVMVTLDADGQHDPREISKLINPILEGEADIVIGSRFLEGTKNDVPAYRRFGIKLITKLSERSTQFSDAQCGFRAYSKKAIENLNLFEKGMGISTEILLKSKELGLKLTEVAVGVRYKGLDTSTHNWLTHGASVIMSIIRAVVEDRPLFYLGIPSVVFLLVGLFFGVWMLQIYTVGGYIATGVALASIAFLLIGLFSMFTAITLYAIIRVAQKKR